MGQNTAQVPLLLLAISAAVSSAPPPTKDGMSTGQPVEFCESMPYLELKKVIWSNLGGLGPDSGREGIFWRVRANRHVGLPEEFEDESLHDLQLRVHATSSYQAKCPECNGKAKDLCQISCESGTNVSVVMQFYDAVTKKNVTLPRGSLTFVDFDREDMQRAIEFVTVPVDTFSRTYTANGTTLLFQRESGMGSITFWAGIQGVGMDNPDRPWILTPTQKRKSLTLQFEHLSELEVTMGSVDAGTVEREMLFAFHPGILCAVTRLPNGVMVNATDSSTTGNPVPVLEFGANAAAPEIVNL